jgi:adenosylhomocysteine nucleosidase
MHTTQSPSSRPVCAAGIIFAMPVEADAFAGLATETVELTAAGLTLHEGVVAGRRVAWCVAGAGGETAGRATRLLIDGHRPRLILSPGFAGGLDPALTRGTVVYPRRAVSREGGPPIAVAATGQGSATAAAGSANSSDDLTIVSVDTVVTTAAAKRELAVATGASLVDMETYAVATAARAAGLPCVSIRVISDDASQDLPTEIAALVQPQSGMRRLGAALAGIGRRPRAALDMWQLWEHAVVDGRTLAGAIKIFLEGLSDSPSAVSRPGSSPDRP